MLVIQPTPFCNINCDYCYLRHRAEHSRMAADTLERVANAIVSDIDPDLEALVVWHGGEPTTVPLAWYQLAYRALGARKRGSPLRFTLQTNGIAIDDDWASFLAETGTNVGLSIDGPRELH